MKPDEQLAPLPAVGPTDGLGDGPTEYQRSDAPAAAGTPSAPAAADGLSDYATDDCVELSTEADWSPRALDALQFAAEQLAQARAALGATTAALINDLAAELNATAASMMQVANEVAGAAELNLTLAEEPLFKLLQALYVAGSKDAERAVDWLREVGADIPWRIEDQIERGELHPFDLLQRTFPAFVAALGGQTFGASAETQPYTQSAPYTQSDPAPWERAPAPVPAADSSPLGSWLTSTDTQEVTGITSNGEQYTSGAPGPLAPVPAPPAAGACPPPCITVNVAPAPVFVMPGGAGGVPTPPARSSGEADEPEPPLPPAPPPTLEEALRKAFPTPPTPGTGVPPPTSPKALPSEAPRKFADPVPAQGLTGQPTGPALAPAAPLTARDQVNGPILPRWDVLEHLRCPPKLGAPPAWMLRNAALLDLPDNIGKDLGGSGENTFQWNDGSSVPAWMRSLSAQTGTAGTALKELQDLIGRGNKPGLPRPLRAIQTGTVLAAANLAERVTGAPVSYLFQSELYEFQSANPQYLPTQVRTDDAYLTAQIDEATWNAWTRANGNLPEPARRTMLANARRLSVDEAITLFRRGGISRGELADRMRLQGVLDPCLGDEYLRITESLPTQGDLVRFMVRDAADESVVQRYGLDADFDQKYTGPLKKWGQALGVPDDYFRFVWRSHWEIPAYTQLREMLHRLRPDRAEVERWDDAAKTYGREAAEKNLGPRPASVTRADVREALTIDDVAPGWVDRLIEVSYTPINRTDALRAYQIGAFDESRLKAAFLDLGYSPPDAETMLAFYKREKDRRQRGQMRVMSPHKVIKYYKAGSMPRSVALKYLKLGLGTDADAEQAIAYADDESRAEQVQVVIRANRRGFFAGDVSAADVRDNLNRWAVDAERVELLLAEWTIERDKRFRKLSASKAMEALKNGIMPVSEADTRLTNLGYTPKDRDYLIARALGVKHDGDGFTDQQLSGAIEDAVRNRKDANKQSNALLMRRLKSILSEAARIRGVLTDRGVDSGAPQPGEP